MLKKVLLGLAVILVGLIVFIATRPEDFRVSRSATLPAPSAVVFGHVNDLHKWEAWSPWGKLDQNAKVTYAGPPAGVGAIFRWAGNNDIGEGAMTITESRANEFVQFRLDFVKPFQATSTAEFTFRPDGEQTVVTWSMAGKNNFMAKAIGLVMDCDKMVGDQFEQGFANLQVVLAPDRKP